MPRNIRKDTQLCISLSGNPSNFGTRFHNFLYDEMDIDFVYKAFASTDLPGAVAGIRALRIRGCGVSMPFKEAVIDLIDVMHDSASAISSVNTIVNEDGVLHAYNTDYQAVADLLKSHGVSQDLPVAVAGSGGMAKAVVAAFHDGGFTDGTVVARNETSGTALADAYGYSWIPELGDERPGIIVNATPMGMAGKPTSGDIPFAPEVIDAAEVVFDVVAYPAETPLIAEARARRKTVITGAEVVVLQAVEQFVLYTGVRPSQAQILRASETALRG